MDFMSVCRVVFDGTVEADAAKAKTRNEETNRDLITGTSLLKFPEPNSKGDRLAFGHSLRQATKRAAMDLAFRISRSLRCSPLPKAMASWTSSAMAPTAPL